VNFAVDLRVHQSVCTRAHAQPERDILEHRHVPEQCVVLEDEPDAPILGAALAGIGPVKQHGARIGGFEAGDNAKQRRLAAP
jgi:hypothetical protein